MASSAGPAGGVRSHRSVVVSSSGVYHTSQSSNWSGYNQGYLSTMTQYHSIGGDWVVPTARQHKAGEAEYSATWIGIGGGCLDTSCTETDDTLIQAGTEQDVATDGTASYSAWWEIVPEPSTTVSITIHPGDRIQCSIIESSTPENWTITLKDLTDGQGFTEQTPYSSDYSTAEWITETPVVVGSGGTGVAALPRLGTVHFSKATANGKNAGLVAADEVQLSPSSGVILATPSAPDKAGNAFNDCTYKTTCTAP